MPDLLVGILVLGVLIGAVMLWSAITDRARKALNRHVFDSEDYHSQQELVGRELVVSSVLTPKEFITQLADRCGFARPGETRRYELQGKFIETDRNENAIAFKYQTGFLKDTTVTVAALPSGDGSRVDMVVHNWIERDGVMIGISDIQKLWRTVQAVAQQSHPTESRKS